ncbi:MAG TPA: beta-ketoacyl-ACP reductase, partial [Gammaproteobacteria bacterium]|nr:beta-ketoacyl-ACP reductase [Gammaproteobacteria bacterium]
MAREHGADVITIGANLNSAEECEGAAQTAIEHFDGVDVLIN